MFKITLSGTCFFKTSFVQSSEPTLLVLPFVGKNKKQEVIRCGEVVERCLKVDWGGESGWAMGKKKRKGQNFIAIMFLLTMKSCFCFSEIFLLPSCILSANCKKGSMKNKRK